MASRCPSPQGFNPYPAISPYGMGNVAWDQTFRDNNGLWFERIMNSNREYYASLDVTYNKIRNPGNRDLGSPHVPIDYTTGGPGGFIIPTYGEAGAPGTGTTTNNAAASTLPLSRAVIDTRVLPYPILVPNNSPPFILLDNHLFPIRNLGVFGDYQSTGLQGRWGFFNEDGTGMSVSGFWTGPSKQGFQRGQDTIGGVKITQNIIASLDGSLLFFRNGAIPLDWGFQSVGAGAANLGTTKYDLLFQYDVKTSAIGADTNFYMTPVVQRQAFKVRSFIGGRYMNINEQFHFRGIDSGFGYNVVTSTTAAGGHTFRPDTNTLQANYDLYEATLTNNVRTNLAGPQVGLRMDFGEGDNFKMWSQTVVGLLANREDYHQFGNNIGDEQGLLLFGAGLDMLATDARFNSTRTVNHVSPLFEQSINAEMKILDMIPGIRRLPGIEDTVFRVGYTMTVVGEVARAGESIDWRGFPKFPSISPGRDTWWTSKWNFGIEKRF
jgi:hypothetical protein